MTERKAKAKAKRYSIHENDLALSQAGLRVV
jgi:hypothetical protein